MHREYRTCQFCKQSDLTGFLVKYGVRHYAHGPCLFKARGREAIDQLSDTAFARLPVIQMLGLGYDVIGEAKKRKQL